MEINDVVEKLKANLAGADLSQTRFHHRLGDFEAIDRVTIEVVPRYKTSGMSGDEWRQSVEVTGYFKGVEVFGFTCGRDMKTAFAMLPGKVIAWGDEGLGSEIIRKEQESCDQPSCETPWTQEYELIRLTASDGHWLDMKEEPFTHYRRFCDEHKRRGDCSREDADENYRLVATPRR